MALTDSITSRVWQGGVLCTIALLGLLTTAPLPTSPFADLPDDTPITLADLTAREVSFIPYRHRALPDAPVLAARPVALLMDTAYVQTQMDRWSQCLPGIETDTCKDGIDYRDPLGGGVPLQRIDDQLDEHLTEHFRIADFASNDGAPYARIDRAFVRQLERLRAEAREDLHILSGYRHPAYNRDEVGGVRQSYHVAGRAADVFANDLTPLELADLAIETLGCTVGLGLGPTTLHIDRRDTVQSWTYPDAELSELEFDMWVAERCGLSDLDLFLAGAETLLADTLAPRLQPQQPSVASAPIRLPAKREAARSPERTPVPRTLPVTSGSRLD